MKIELVEYPDAADIKAVSAGLMQFNNSRVGESGFLPFALFIRDDDHSIIGGLVGRLWWSWMYVEKFWVAEKLRGSGAGSKLLSEAEEFARNRGCVGAALDTIDPEALRFYEKRGFSLFGVLEGFPPGHRQWFLRKSLL